MKHLFSLATAAFLAALSAAPGASAQNGAGGFDCKGDPQCEFDPDKIDGGAVVIDRGNIVSSSGGPAACCTNQRAPGDFTEDTDSPSVSGPSRTSDRGERVD